MPVDVDVHPGDVHFAEHTLITVVDDDTADDPDEVTFELACSGELIITPETGLQLCVQKPEDIRRLGQALIELAAKAARLVA